MGRIHKNRPSQYRIQAKTARRRIWFVLKSKQEFTIEDIIRLAEAKRSNAAQYMRMLVSAGYVTSTGKPKRFRLIRDTGLNPPIYQKKYNRLYDPNTQRVYSIGN